MKKFIVTLALTSFILTGLQNSSFAQTTPNLEKAPNQIEHNKREFGLTKKLNLTEDQGARAKEIRAESRAKIKPVIDQMRTEKQKYREMVKSNASPDELQKQKEKVAELMRQAKEIHRQNIANFEQILTSEQKTKFEELKKQRMNRMKERRQWKTYKREDEPLNK